ncbi:hypothetical protein XENORESO_008280 [Xenotaenia resolanae]|uniref:Uncharacterized protein n=1 Tax=Xenotaenia resolanae TaxID=208358 RepID=A0ABV0X2G4_9TELE
MEDDTCEDMLTANAQERMGTANAVSLWDGLATVTKEIREIKQVVRSDLATFKEEFNGFQEELNVVREQIESKLSEKRATRTKKGNRGSTNKNQWPGRLEYRSKTSSLKEQELKEKLTDLEGRSRSNNMRIFGIPEGAKGDSIPCYVDKT